MSGGGLRKRQERRNAQLPRETVRDTRLSFRAVGVLLWLMDRPDGWAIRADQMAKDGKRPDGKNADGHKHRREGREAIRTVLLEELGEAGYYRLERRRLRDGSIKMGTAISDLPVESWAAQHTLFGRNAVPMVEQPDGTFLVQYPDGTLGPDDCEPPEMPPPDSGQEDEPAGHTEDGFLDTGNDAQPDGAGLPGSRNPAPVEPAPATPASGEPASGNPSPLVKEEEKGLEEKENPPLPPVDQAGADSDDMGGGEEIPANKPTPTMAGIVDWFAQQRPDWSSNVVAEALNAAVDKGLGDLPTAASALRELAEGKHGETSSPRRLLYAEGRWWANVRGRRSRTAPRAAGPRCPVPHHDAQPEDGCGLCLGEVKACPDCPSTARRCDHGGGVVADVGQGAQWLPRHLRPRVDEDAEPDLVRS